MGFIIVGVLAFAFYFLYKKAEKKEMTAEENQSSGVWMGTPFPRVRQRKEPKKEELSAKQLKRIQEKMKEQGTKEFSQQYRSPAKNELFAVSLSWDMSDPAYMHVHMFQRKDEKKFASHSKVYLHALRSLVSGEEVVMLPRSEKTYLHEFKLNHDVASGEVKIVSSSADKSNLVILNRNDVEKFSQVVDYLLENDDNDSIAPEVLDQIDHFLMDVLEQK